MASITPELVKGARPDSLFVLGRNIYQAACGSSNSAIEYLTEFMNRTNGFGASGRKSLLDGMLFEIFFDSRAKLRTQPKTRYFDDVFELQQHKALAASFAFISECLLAHLDRFHAIPGKPRDITVDVVTKKDAEGRFLIERVLFEGADILWIDDDDVFEGKTSHRAMSVEKFTKRLSDEMIVPARLLRATYSFDDKAKPVLLLPEGGTIRKR
jgi:hypothetical protein